MTPSRRPRLTRDNLGFLMAKALARWNAVLYDEFRLRGYPQVRPAYGSILIPLFEEDGLRMTELARRARLSKQAMTTMVRLMQRNGLVTRRRDPEDRRAFRIYLTPTARTFRGTAERALARLDAAVRRAAPGGSIAPARTLLAALADLPGLRGR